MKRKSIELGMLALLHSVQHVYMSTLPPIYLLIRQEFNVSTLQIGIIGSIQGIINVLQGPASYLVEKIGEKRLAVLSMLICSVAVFFYSLSPSFSVLLVFVTIYAFSTVPFHPATYSMVQKRSAVERKTKDIAYHQVGGFLGSAIGIAVIAYLAFIFGWRTSLQIIPIVGIIMILMFWKTVKEKKPINKSFQNNEKNRDRFRLTIPLLILLLVTVIYTSGGILNYIPLFLSEAYGETVAWAGILTGIMQAVGCVSMIIGGIISDRFDKVSIVFISYVLTGFSVISLAVGSYSSGIMLLLLITFGVMNYFPVSTMHSLSSIAASDHPQGIGFRYAFIALGSFLSAPLIGYLTDTLGIRSAFVVCSIFPFISAACILLLKKWKPNEYARVTVERNNKT